MFLFLQAHCISTVHLPYEPLFLLFLSFLPLSAKELFTARTHCYCVAVIVILLYFSFPCQYSCTSFSNFFYFFISSLFLYRRRATFVYERRRHTPLHAPPPASKRPASKSPVYFFGVFALVFFPNFDTTDLTAYRLRKFCNEFNNARTLVQRSFVFYKVKKLNLKFTARRKSRRKNYRRLNCLACRKRSPGTARTV